MNTGARLASATWPLAGRLFRERLEIDENRALWVEKTPGYRPRPPLHGRTQADVAIIGGGFTGASTAYHLSRRFPARRIVLLEAATLANGASGRNGGMMLNWVNGYDDASSELAARIYQVTSAAIDNLCALIERHHLPVDYRRDGTVTIYTDDARGAAAHALVVAQNAIGIPTQFFDATMLRQKLAVAHGCGAIFDPGAGQINGAQLVRGLAPVLEAQGVQIYEGTPVQRVEEGRTITLTTPQGEVQANALVLATNGYTGALGYFRDALFPLHSHVFATAALTPAQQQALGWHGLAGFSDDFDRISYASLTRDGHLVFGGGSNHAYSYLFNNRTAYAGRARRAQAEMARTLNRYFPQSHTLPITHRWAGTLGITFDRRPLIGVRGAHHNVYYALGYCGHGVTLANLAGEILCDLYAGDDSRWRDLPFVQSGYPRIPPEPFRWIGYQLFTRLTGQSPRL
ncbi:MAG: FAD-dependent oxidoreductase [Caldilineaceae bacterium]|nr:FAD-dependent oxidoreductase [Caldilineaceae bacterium]